MKKYFKIILPLLSLLFLCAYTNAQTKKTTKAPAVKKTTSTKVAIKATDRSFGAPTSISQVTDVTDASPSYESLRNLIEMYGVTTTYADNTFKGKEALKRGDFVVAFNSALVSIKRSMDAAHLDSSIINTYDRNRGGSYLTGIEQVTDVPENSIYYPAAKSLLERWGIGAPFTLNKTLNPGSTISEKEVYDILRITLGYNGAGAGSTTAITREKFAIALNGAVAQKMQTVAMLDAAKKQEQAKKDEEKRQLENMLMQQEMIRKDSIAKEVEQNKLAAQQREEEAKKKLAEKDKNPK